MPASPRAEGARRATPWGLSVAGLVVGVWALLPPYTGPALNTEARVEIADHVVPGLVVIVASGATLLVQGWARRSGIMFATGLLVTLAGFWMTATHVPLLAQATRDEAPMGAAVYHTLPGLAVTALGLVWAARHRHEPVPVQGSGPPPVGTPKSR